MSLCLPNVSLHLKMVEPVKNIGNLFGVGHRGQVLGYIGNLLLVTGAGSKCATCLYFDPFNQIGAFR